MSEQNFFKADLRELEFSLFEQFKVGELFKKPPFDHLTEDDLKMILKEAHTFASNVVGPTLQVSDQEGCQWSPSGVKVPATFKPLWKKFYGDGWNTLTLPDERGGQGAPLMVENAVGQMMSGANTSFFIYTGLTSGAAELIAKFGTEEQKKLFLTPMDEGRWSGTMLLTEPQAGSDVGLNATKAAANPDGSYNITGTKIFISGGDQDLTENIIHMTLARIEGAPKGTKGLSLFIVPKRRVNPDGSLGELNDVACTGIEHKLGINASATAQLSFGDNGKCVGYLLGGPPKEGEQVGAGMIRMFNMMNTARVEVGGQALAVASTAYLNALAYARTRRQGASLRHGRPPEGAVFIIEHPDVRRMLLEMKCLVEGCRAMMMHATRLEDMSRQVEGAQAEELEDDFALLIPMIKAFLSDTAVHVTSTAMQVYAGAGYTRDYPAEQYYRDARIFPIYEGTNGIQAMDLVGRKLAHKGGAPIGRFAQQTGAFVEKLAQQKGWQVESANLKAALDGFNKALGQYMNFIGQDKIELIPLTGTRFLRLMSLLLLGRLLADGALVAEAALAQIDPASSEGQFYQGKVASARFFMRDLLPETVFLAEVIASGDETALAIPDGGFSTVF